MKRNFIVVIIILSGLALIIENRASAFETNVFLKEETSWTGRTTLKFDQPVNGVEKLVYHPLARTLDKVFTFRNRSGKTLYLAHESSLQRKSIVTLYQLDGDTPVRMATIQDTANGKIEIIISRNQRLGRGTNQLDNKRNPRISLSEVITDSPHRIDSTRGKYTIDRTAPGIFKITVKDNNHFHEEPILYLAAYIAFQKHKMVRRRDIAISTAALIAILTGKYWLSRNPTTPSSPILKNDDANGNDHNSNLHYSDYDPTPEKNDFSPLENQPGKKTTISPSPTSFDDNPIGSGQGSSLLGITSKVNDLEDNNSNSDDDKKDDAIALSQFPAFYDIPIKNQNTRRLLQSQESFQLTEEQNNRILFAPTEEEAQQEKDKMISDLQNKQNAKNTKLKVRNLIPL